MRLLLPLALAVASPDTPATSAREVRVLMGTTAEVRVAEAPRPDEALNAAFAALDRVDALMSLWHPSELTRLNADGRAQVSAETFAVVSRAIEISRATEGAFDATAMAKTRTAGRDRVHLDPGTLTIALDPGARLDLGGIAKGYAVDLALAAAREKGARRAVVSLGGSSVAALGEPITIVLRDPEHPEAPAWGEFTPDGLAVGTSGGDQRPGHILDPRTGDPAHGVLAATVLAPTAMDADALGTALFVLGAREGLALLAARGTEGLVLVRQRGRRHILTTPGFAGRHRLRARAGVVVREL